MESTTPTTALQVSRCLSCSHWEVLHDESGCRAGVGQRLPNRERCLCSGFDGGTSGLEGWESVKLAEEQRRALQRMDGFHVLCWLGLHDRRGPRRLVPVGRTKLWSKACARCGSEDLR
jgi:hypothetical protein